MKVLSIREVMYPKQESYRVKVCKSHIKDSTRVNYIHIICAKKKTVALQTASTQTQAIQIMQPDNKLTL